MTDAPDINSLFDPRTWLRAWTSWPGAPNNLVQPILPGWSFGNVIVNEENSSSPATEQSIVAKASYGKQIGRLLDAVGVLVDRAQAEKDDPAFTALQALRDEVEAIKNAQVERGVDQLAHDLSQLYSRDQVVYRAMIAKLQALLGDQPPTAQPPTAGSVQ